MWRARRDDFRATTICEAVFEYGAFSAFLKGVPAARNKRGPGPGDTHRRLSDARDPAGPLWRPQMRGTRHPHRSRCVYTVADTIKRAAGNDPPCGDRLPLSGAEGLIRYVKRNGRCEPRWAGKKMVEVAAIPCTMIKNQPLRDSFLGQGWRRLIGLSADDLHLQPMAYTSMR